MKQTPPVALIETALEMLLDTDHTRALTEFRALGRHRLERLKDVTGPQNALERGYLLGLETAATMILTMPAAQLAKIEL
jgi:hypothetical protein